MSVVPKKADDVFEKLKEQTGTVGRRRHLHPTLIWIGTIGRCHEREGQEEVRPADPPRLCLPYSDALLSMNART